jgi:transposase
MNPRCYEITDFEWLIIVPLLPNKPWGVPHADDKTAPDANGNPITVKLSEGQAHYGHGANGLLNTIFEGQILLAD